MTRCTTRIKTGSCRCADHHDLNLTAGPYIAYSLANRRGVDKLFPRRREKERRLGVYTATVPNIAARISSRRRKCIGCQIVGDFVICIVLSISIDNVPEPVMGFAYSSRGRLHVVIRIKLHTTRGTRSSQRYV